MQVRHWDDNPANNAVTNLRYGTRLDNAADAVRNGRTASGVRNGMAKLSAEQVAAARADLAAGRATQKEIATRLGISKQNAHLIATGKTWRTLDRMVAAAMEPPKPDLFAPTPEE